MTEIRNFTRPDIYGSQDLSAGALSFTTSIGRKFCLDKIVFHASVAITETITITLDSVNGSTYDAVLRRKSLSNAQDYVYTPEGQNNFFTGDEIKLQCTNANLTGVLYYVIKTRDA